MPCLSWVRHLKIGPQSHALACHSTKACSSSQLWHGSPILNINYIHQNTESSFHQHTKHHGCISKIKGLFISENGETYTIKMEGKSEHPASPVSCFNPSKQNASAKPLRSPPSLALQQTAFITSLNTRLPFSHHGREWYGASPNLVAVNVIWTKCHLLKGPTPFKTQDDLEGILQNKIRQF